ncbi:MAG: glyoxalase/bleomycin resistance/dioxygenase family protein [Moraxellaceae bacterium]|nr:MAG: glyoxalase/bleomycin resistance/dioxygenase family protein [Moraxellaceae bacterium]
MRPTLTHMALHVKNLEACVTFYKKYCKLRVIHDREKHHKHIIWMAEKDHEHTFVFVLLEGGPYHNQIATDFSHLGFAVNSKTEVESIAQVAEQEGILAWPPVQEPYPVGYYCGVKDPNGNFVEFSYGQPLGPGSENMPL